MRRSTVAASGPHRLVAVPGGGAVTGTRVGVPVGAGSGAGVLSVRSGTGWLQAAVLATELAEVPAKHVAIDEDLAAQWDLDVADRQRWQLDLVDAVPVGKLVLELATEREPGEAAREFAQAGLVGELLWVPAKGTDFSVSVNGVPHRVHEVDAGGHHEVVARITKNTVVELYAPASRAGVDVVVLADTSFSMQMQDLPAVRASAWGTFTTGEQWITRVEALRESLRDLLEMRTRVSGRVSRLALLEFNGQVRQVFPHQPGMVQLDADSPAPLVDDFRRAVASMKPSGSTDIGQALHAAANLLHRNGRPGNEKLVVLVSDGANWVPRGESGTGEIVSAVKEPVSLMEHLHRDLGIRLHAVGISDENLYRRRGGDMRKAEYVPNHTLLRELVKVGGGDSTTVGGLDALAGYFGGLGGGIVHRVQGRLTAAPKPGPLPERTRTALQALRHTGTEDWDRHREELKAGITELAGRCDTEFQRSHGQDVWVDRFVLQLSGREFGSLVADVAGAANFLVRVSRGLRPQPDHAAFAPLVALLDELRSIGENGGVDYGRVTGLCGKRADSPGSVQVLVMRRVHDVMTDVHRALSSAPAPVIVIAAPASTARPASSFVYRN
ncbi:von Willebrand factor type A domain-containing protein [Lentzea waywayandensis]|uniref:von Willebrand factor type A domain-containing protein n=1 Tax=Lentzea waywayandensis TaxID=84724 RepID=A0A1I6EZ79_9PSEU|nr:vWA domain-containing protein [Lentzea waywayandensis]SFR22897.1 von Willebrand factor type A domain-containing protein [Lentzea waywayandensis]